MLENSAAVARQHIDSLAVFEALEEAQAEAAHVRGGMYWHAGRPGAPEDKYLIRTSPAGSQTSLGLRSAQTEAIYERFMQRKRESVERVKGLQAALEQHQRLNRALRVGRVDPLVVSLLSRLSSTQSSDHFRVVGTHALYAYEASAGVRLDAQALATRDIDLLWDTRKRILFSTQLARVDSSMLGVLKKVDPTFRIRKSQMYTAVNKTGFEVDIIRREQAQDDPHPIKPSEEDDDFWVAQARRANVLLDAPAFSAVLVATNGSMARMNTVHPATFITFKRWLGNQTQRDPLKRRRDLLQADTVQTLLENYLPHLERRHLRVDPTY
jgi:hypothetical protein